MLCAWGGFARARLVRGKGFCMHVCAREGFMRTYPCMTYAREGFMLRAGLPTGLDQGSFWHLPVNYLRGEPGDNPVQNELLGAIAGGMGGDVNFRSLDSMCVCSI